MGDDADGGSTEKFDIGEGADEESVAEPPRKTKIFPTAFMGTDTTPFDMGERDPNHINPHLQISWDDIVGEPEGLRSPETCWNCSKKCYYGTRTSCYVFMVVLFSPIIAFINGCQFACVSFNQIWCVGPCLRLVKINMATLRRFWETVLLATCGPCSEILGLYFSKIKVRYQRLPDGEAKDVEASAYFNV